MNILISSHFQTVEKEVGVQGLGSHFKFKFEVNPLKKKIQWLGSLSFIKIALVQDMFY